MYHMEKSEQYANNSSLIHNWIENENFGIDHISLSTTPIFLYKNNTLISQGTGFFYVHQDLGTVPTLYLITNYHVLTGSSPLEKKPPIGDKIEFQIHNSETELGKIKNISLPLFAKNGKQVWITSKSDPEADLAVIPIFQSFYEGCKINCISEEWTKDELKVRPTTNVSLVGYPYGFYDKKNSLPIWKTGSVASEPNIDFEGKPLFLVDISAFPGMSGSPVFAISYGASEKEGGVMQMGQGIKKFLGLYASMQMIGKNKYLEEIIHNGKIGIVDSESLEIGHVWKANLVLELVKSIDLKKYQEEVQENLM